MLAPNSPEPAGSAIGVVPHAWPELLSLVQVCAYLCMSPDTFRKTCPVPPLLLAVSIRRWRRSDIDAWIAGLPVRLARSADNDCDARISPIAASQIAGEERRFIALERVKHRASRKSSKN